MARVHRAPSGVRGVPRRKAAAQALPLALLRDAARCRSLSGGWRRRPWLWPQRRGSWSPAGDKREKVRRDGDRKKGTAAAEQWAERCEHSGRGGHAPPRSSALRVGAPWREDRAAGGGCKAGRQAVGVRRHGGEAQAPADEAAGEEQGARNPRGSRGGRRPLTVHVSPMRFLACSAVSPTRCCISAALPEACDSGGRGGGTQKSWRGGGTQKSWKARSALDGPRGGGRGRC